MHVSVDVSEEEQELDLCKTEESHTWERTNHSSRRIARLPTQSEQSITSPLCAEDYIDYRSVHPHAVRAPSMSS